MNYPKEPHDPSSEIQEQFFWALQNAKKFYGTPDGRYFIKIAQHLLNQLEITFRDMTDLPSSRKTI
jgi:hypothetical protein